MTHEHDAQLLLPGINKQIYATFTNFVVADNQGLIQHLRSLSSQPHFSLTYLWGVEGAGVSHLLEACCDAAGQQQQSAIYLPLNQLSGASSVLFEGLERLDWVCIDDLQCLETQPAWQEALFHQYNRMQTDGGRLVVGAKCPPRGLAVLADLQSRLASGVIWQVQTLSDTDKMAAMLQTAAAKGMRLPETVAQFLLERYSRRLPDLLAAVERLDKAALMQKRRLTIPFVKQILVI